MTINVNNSSTITEVLGNRTHHSCKPVVNKTTGDVYASATDAAEAIGTTVKYVSMCCHGKLKSCKGNRLSYLSRTSENVDELTARIRILNAKIAELEEDAAVGRKIREEEEAARKAEEARLKAIEDTNAALAKVREKKTRRERIIQNIDAQLQAAVARLTATEQEEAELEMKLLELKGDVKA